ncbi:pectinesterase [Ricinus communis]|uniref:Pectinesterase n=1 Tax=Ricinus communis TaxID=3988 RepID=B9S005_RICCO|nr:pectinesterase [Ricinus communis]EEF43188.1 Pectinesterase-3 precursor, putative [Ricinus communis]|eukprot:XP_002519324.1 pectinesterase [Ricinus communis]
MTIAKVIVGGISIILVVGVCIVLIAGLSNNTDTSAPDENDDNKILSATSMAVAAFCNQTDHKHRCVDSVFSVARNQSATFNDFLKAAISYTIEHVKLAMDTAATIGKDAKDSTQKMAVEDCQELLQFAIGELQDSLLTVKNSSFDAVKEREADLKNWLSAVMSYKETCLDGLNDTNLHKPMSDGLVNATELTSNALAIVSAISDIGNAFRIPSNLNASATRRLMEAEDDGFPFPTWMPNADRKLLGSATNANVKPNAIVAQDGSGQYKTIAAALAAYPKDLVGRYIINVKAGVYDEYITINKDQVNVFIYGDGPRKTTVTGDKCNKKGFSTFKTASFSAVGDGFMAKSIGFQNTAGAKGGQAVALRIQSDRAALYNCRMDGHQDTLYQHAHRQFYRNCVISGTVDFIFGDATAVIQNSLIIIRTPDPGQRNAVTAHGRADKRESTGLVIQNCRILPEQSLFPVISEFPSYLGRPWKQYARTVIMESEIGSVIQPAGWLEWTGNLYLDTLFYAEYGNRGPGANTNLRVKWKGYHVLTDKSEVTQFTAGPFLQGDQWLQATGFPYLLGLKSP